MVENDLIARIEALTARTETLERELSRLQLETDNGYLSAFMTVIGQDVYESLSLAVEQGVANYFGISRELFHDNLVSVRSKGKKGKLVTENPKNIDCFEDRIIVSRYILYGIMHIDFCIPIQDLSVYYSVNVKSYIRQWKARYIRIFHSDGPFAKDDDIYRNYWECVHEAIIVECHRVGIFDKLVDKLKRFDINGEVSYIYLQKWRIE
jgi:hypothetical protein